MRKPIIAITMGDPGGIGPEVIVKALQEIPTSERFHYLVIGARQPFEFLQREYDLEVPFHFMQTFDFDQLKTDAVNFLDLTPAIADEYVRMLEKETGEKVAVPEELVFDIGKNSLMNACMTHTTLQAAANYAAAGSIDAVVTAPVNKTTVRLVEPGFTGHTEFLAKASGASRFAMMFVHDRLKVTLATIHVPIKKVSKLITKELIFEKISLTDHFLRTYFNLEKPKIAVCALNPHGQETGDEEVKAIEPAIELAQQKKIEVAGPFSADRLFYDVYEEGRYDAVISMYHDQGLAPFKMVAFHDGVNTTLGLPFIRTSPDHGTAFDIAYQNKAESDSMKSSIKLSEKLLALS